MKIFDVNLRQSFYSKKLIEESLQLANILKLSDEELPAVDTRLSLYTYLNKIAGDNMTKLYNWANVIIFTVISAAMITVSSTAVRFLLIFLRS